MSGNIVALLGLCCKRKETPNEHGLLWRYAGVFPLARGRAIRGSAIAPFSARRVGLKTLRAAAIPHAKNSKVIVDSIIQNKIELTPKTLDCQFAEDY